MDARSNNERLAAGEVEVDLRAALSAGREHPGDAERSPAGEPSVPDRRAAHPHQTAEPGALVPASDVSGLPAAPAAPAPDRVTPSPVAAEMEGRTPSELLPADIYRIVDGHEDSGTAFSRARRAVRDLLTSPPARHEERLDNDLRQLRVRGLARGVTVALGSIKGGVGKTTLTLTLADMLADALRCGVLVVDADLEWGTAADSTPQNAGRGGSLSDVLAARHRITSPGELAPFLVALPGGAQLLAGPTDPQQIEQITAEDMQELLETLKRFFPVILLDLSPGIGLRGTIPRWAFGAADEIVAIATPTRGSLRRAGRMLEYLTEHRPDAPITLALNMVPRRPDEAAQRILHVAEHNGVSRRYVGIPHDAGLMRGLDAGALDLTALDQPTRIAIKELAVGLATGWCR